MTPYSATGPVFAAFRPGAVSLSRLRPDSGVPNTWAGRAAELHPAGDRARVRVEGPVPLIAEVTTIAVAQLNLADGGPVWTTLQPTDIDVYPI
jgi:molybdate transport system ATP-binding protein